MPKSRRKVTPKKVMQILAENGTEVTLEQAELILDFTYNFAKLSLHAVLYRDFEEKSPRVKTPRKQFK